MRYYQARSRFTAQSVAVSALMSMYDLMEQDEHVRLPLTPVVVFLAFSVESYLNSIGARVMPGWDEMERLPWRSKVNILHSVVRREPDWGKGPLQFAAEVFRLRDKLAHGKPEDVLGPRELTEGGPTKLAFGSVMLPEWFRAIDREWVFKAKDRFKELMLYLGSLFDLYELDYLQTSERTVLVHDEPDT